MAGTHEKLQNHEPHAINEAKQHSTTRENYISNSKIVWGKKNIQLPEKITLQTKIL